MFYAVTVVSLYTASGLFHGLKYESLEVRRTWQLLDQTAIFWLSRSEDESVLDQLKEFAAANDDEVSKAAIFAISQHHVPWWCQIAGKGP